jgi:hypothetical protein
LQGTTCYPPLLDELKDQAVQATCVLGYCGWQGEGLHTVGQLDEFFQKLCDAADQNFPEPAACRFFLNWYDDTPRDEMRRELFVEVALALRERHVAAA